MAILTTYPAAADPFAERPGAHSGLDFAFGPGRLRDGPEVHDLEAGTVTLEDDTTNWVEADPEDGQVKVAEGEGFTEDRIPLFQVETEGGEIKEVKDKRCFFSVGAGPAEEGFAVGWGLLSLDVVAEGEPAGLAPLEFSTDAENDELQADAHGLVDDDPVSIAEAAGGLELGGLYFVVNAATDTFQIAEEEGGDPVEIDEDADGVLIKEV